MRRPCSNPSPFAWPIHCHRRDCGSWAKNWQPRAKTSERSGGVSESKPGWMLAWCVMPNQVHVLIEQQAPLSKIVQSWKSYTGRWAPAHAAELGISVPGKRFWMRDYWDRYIRDQHHLNAVIAYIHNNPGKAGLLSIVARKGATVFPFTFEFGATVPGYPRSFSSACAWLLLSRLGERKPCAIRRNRTGTNPSLSLVCVSCCYS
ncbi:transposase [Desulfacinum hydrothermale]|uniref:transposase n=1 Tax=Desulfacinum hydrothermale TaxID=109258 RepID=UPI0031832721